MAIECVSREARAASEVAPHPPARPLRGATIVGADIPVRGASADRFQASALSRTGEHPCHDPRHPEGQDNAPSRENPA